MSSSEDQRRQERADQAQGDERFRNTLQHQLEDRRAVREGREAMGERAGWVELRDAQRGNEYHLALDAVAYAHFSTGRSQRGPVADAEVARLVVAGQMVILEGAPAAVFRRHFLAHHGQPDSPFPGPPADPPQGEAHSDVSGRRAAQDAATRAEYDEDEALRRFDAESEREGPP